MTVILSAAEKECGSFYELTDNSLQRNTVSEGSEDYHGVCCLPGIHGKKGMSVLAFVGKCSFLGLFLENIQDDSGCFCGGEQVPGE